MPLLLIGAFLVLYGMGYIVIAFVEPPMWVVRFFPMPINALGVRSARAITGIVLFVLPLVAAYVMLRR